MGIEDPDDPRFGDKQRDAGDGAGMHSCAVALRGREASTITQVGHVAPDALDKDLWMSFAVETATSELPGDPAAVAADDALLDMLGVAGHLPGDADSELASCLAAWRSEVHSMEDNVSHLLVPDFSCLAYQEGELVTDVPDVPEQHRPALQAGRTIDRTIPSTCQIHGARGFCNLRVTKAGGTIVLDPHVAGSCVITLDEDGAVALHDLLIEWLGHCLLGEHS